MIHKFKFKNMNIVLDVSSGSLHIVDALTWEILDFYEDLTLEEITDKLSERYKKTEIIESYGEIIELVENSLLFSKDKYEEVINAKKNRNPVVKALCLHVAHDCNLRCKYCFAGEGEYQGERALMSSETGKAAIDFLIRESGNRRNLEVDYFGGEPLMNFAVVKEITEYARSLEEKHNKKFRFTMTTNGILLDEQKLSYINRQMHNLVLSLDGRKTVNDNMRLCENGRSSYDIIVPKFIKAAQSRNQNGYYLRGTFTAENLDFCEDVEHIASLGFKQISVEPVVLPSHDPLAIKEEHIEAIFHQYDKLSQYLCEAFDNGEELNFFHFMVDLSGGPCIWKRTSGCGAGSEYLAVTPTGELFPCHQFVGMNGFKMGDVYSGVTNTEITQMFEDCHVYAKENCRACWARFYCSGGCNANSYNQNADMFKPYEIGCLLQKKRIECAIGLAAYKAGV